MAINKSKDYLKNVDERALELNKLSGWTYGESVITEQYESFVDP